MRPYCGGTFAFMKACVLAAALVVLACSDDKGPQGVSGAWVGYVESYGFPSGSHDINMTIDKAGQGTITFGEGTPPKDLDPEVGFPADYDGLLSGWVQEGFPFTILNPAVGEDRFTFDAARNEQWKEWCELQTPIPDVTDSGETNYYCEHNWGIKFSNGICTLLDPESDDELVVDCMHHELCVHNFICRCEKDGCGMYTFEDDHSFQFDLHFDGVELNGSAQLPGTDLRNVYLSRGS